MTATAVPGTAVTTSRTDARLRVGSLIMALGAVAVTVLATNGPAAASTSEPCAYGDARMRFETFPLTFEGTPPPCTYRLFFNGRTFAFSEGDFFLGGVVERESYGEDASRSQAIATLEAVEIRVWLAEVTAGGTGPLVEQVVERTAIKSANYEPFGQHVWAQWGVIRQLPAGEYLSVMTVDSPLDDPTTFTVRLVITPSS